MLRTGTVIGLALLLAGLARPGAASQASLEGHWRIDSAGSHDLERQIGFLAARGGLNSRGGLQGGPRSTGGIPGAAGGPVLPDRTPGAQEVSYLAQAVELVLQLPEVFQVRQTDSSVTIHPLDLRLDNQVMHTDGRKVVTLISADEVELETRARWRDSRLEVERKTDDIRALISFSAADGSTLVAVIEVRGRPFKQPFTIRKVYRAVE